MSTRYGERLRELRAEHQLSLRQVEERGGPNKDTMSLLERGVHKPHAQTLGRIAQAFGMSVSNLRSELEGADSPKGLPDLRQPIDLDRYEGDLLELKDALEAERLRLRPIYTSTEAFFNPTPEQARTHRDYLVVLDNSLAVRDALLRDRGLVK